jgi:uncharacterized protein
VFKNCFDFKNEVCDVTVVKLGALLHDIADSKFHDGDETIGPKLLENFRIRKVMRRLSRMW